jgi:predicted amidohydrolase
MKVACIQLKTGENYNFNFIKIIKLINKSIDNNSDLIITPETSTIMTLDKAKLFKNSFSMSSDPLIKKIKKICIKNKKWILIGSITIKDKKKLRNRSIMINPKGKIEGFYDKISMFDVNLSKKETHNESEIFIPGKKLKVIQLPWGKIGLTICYDLRFPEIYRNLSQKKLHFISVPSAFTKMTGKKHWLTLLKARAIENFCFIFAPNQSGKNTKDRETFGHSVIISPDGKIIKLKKKGVGIIYANINPTLCDKLKKIIPSYKINKFN